MTDNNPESSGQDHQSKVAKKPPTAAIVTAVLIFICILFALVLTLRNQVNKRFVKERYPIEQLELELKQKQKQHQYSNE